MYEMTNYSFSCLAFRQNMFDLMIRPGKWLKSQVTNKHKAKKESLLLHPNYLKHQLFRCKSYRFWTGHTCTRFDTAFE